MLFAVGADADFATEAYFAAVPAAFSAVHTAFYAKTPLWGIDFGYAGGYNNNTIYHVA